MYIGITIGDPSGVGPEITLKALANHPEYLNTAIVFGSKQVMDYYHDALKINSPINYIEEVTQFKKDHINVLYIEDIKFSEAQIGLVNAESGKAAFGYVEAAIKQAMQEKIGLVITGPLNKEALNLAGYPYDGHTEIFAELTGTKKYTMMLWSEQLAVVHVSTHVSLSRACELVTKERVMECIDLANAALKRLGIDQPKIAVAGLNPHSGESGLFGNEEADEIIPAIKAKKDQGIHVTGPISPDIAFLKAYQGDFDIVVAMYHDQGHIPMKLLAFDSGVNVTLGLPIIRTSVDHGTAFDIAGQGIASELSLVEAIKLGNRFIAE